ncbi:MAG: hypothetical protein ACREOG_04330 [Gemmatimonadaceae bacterium]
MPPSSREKPPAHPRVLIVMPAQWHRALLRAALREVGYDAVGTRTLATALRISPAEPDRGPVRLIIVDHAAVTRRERDHLTRLLQLHGRPATMLLARPTMSAPLGRWDRVLRRPLSISDIVAGAQELLPLPLEARHPSD